MVLSWLKSTSPEAFQRSVSCRKPPALSSATSTTMAALAMSATVAQRIIANMRRAFLAVSTSAEAPSAIREHLLNVDPHAESSMSTSITEPRSPSPLVMYPKFDPGQTEPAQPPCPFLVGENTCTCAASCMPTISQRILAARGHVEISLSKCSRAAASEQAPCSLHNCRF